MKEAQGQKSSTSITDINQGMTRKNKPKERKRHPKRISVWTKYHP